MFPYFSRQSPTFGIGSFSCSSLGCATLFACFIAAIVLPISFARDIAIDNGFPPHVCHGIAILILVVAWVLIVIAIKPLLKTLDFYLPEFPERCESGKCALSDCYHVQLGIIRDQFKRNEFESQIVYFKCQCGDEYLRYGAGFIAKINEDGSLSPYKHKSTIWEGHYSRLTSLLCNFAIPQGTLRQLRNESTASSFVFTNETTNCLELCTHCDCVRDNVVQEVSSGVPVQSVSPVPENSVSTSNFQEHSKDDPSDANESLDESTRKE